MAELTASIRSFDTACATAHGSDKADAAARLPIPDGWEAVQICYVTIRRGVSASAILRSTDTRTVTGRGPTRQDAIEDLISALPAEHRDFQARLLRAEPRESS